MEFVGVETGYACKDGKYAIKSKFSICADLLAAVKKILKIRNK
jgi:hypothetical protein